MKRFYCFLLFSAGISIIIFFILRFIFFNIVIHKIEKRLQEKIGATLTYQAYQFKGLTGVELNKILIKTTDTLFWADTCQVRFKFLSIFKSHKSLNEIKLINSNLIVSNKIIHTLLKDNTNKLPANKQPLNYSMQGSNFIMHIFGNIPEKITLKNIHINYTDSSYLLITDIGSLQLKNNKLAGIISFLEANQINNSFSYSGIFDKKRKKISIEVKGNKEHLPGLPFISTNWKLNCKFSTFNAEFKVVQHLSDRLNLQFTCWFDSLYVTHPKLSDETVYFSNLGFNINSTITRNTIELDSTSQIIFNQFKFSSFLQFKNEKFRQVQIGIPYQEFDASDFFAALPASMFKNISGIKVDGKLSYFLNFKINLDSLDEVHLNAQLKGHNFRVLQYGRAHLSMLNDTFHIFRHEPGFDPVYIKVDSNSSAYTRWSEISKYLIYSVLTSEDGSFFYHRGFNEEAIASSIAENIKRKRFARGGSTITMQLVKNVFLNRKKNISRKFEELLLTWLLENTGIVSKEKMLEIYFNIIEWGPNIYGIQQAAHYYFNKKPSQLNLKESIFLASIIPSPKYFRYTFKHNGKLKDNFDNYFQRMASIMLSRNQISPTDTMGLNIFIKLSGKSKELLLSPTSTVSEVDSSYIEEQEDLYDY